MAVSIDDVYQRVLALANKEQRGYITPQEFNLLAQKAQMDIFEQYFHDMGIGMLEGENDTQYGNRIDSIREKLLVFQVYKDFVPAVTDTHIVTLPADVHVLGDVFYNDENNIHYLANEIDVREAQYVFKNPLLAPTKNRPSFLRMDGNKIRMYPEVVEPAWGITRVMCNYIAKPADPKWTYVIVNEKALYNAFAGDRQDFSLHASEESTLTNRILELAGIVINKPGLSEVILRNQAVKEANENR